MPYVFAALLCAFAAAYAIKRRSGSLLSRVFYKCAASVSFLLLAVSIHTGMPHGYYTLIVAGLCASLAGDVCLLFADRGEGFLLGGMAAFAAAHGFYIAGFWTIASPSWVDAVFFAALMALAFLLLRARRINVGHSAAALWGYAALLCLMTARAVSMLWAAQMPMLFGVFAAAGGVLFAVSDMLLGVEQRTGSRLTGSLSTIAYYAAQGLLALTVQFAMP